PKGLSRLQLTVPKFLVSEIMGGSCSIPVNLNDTSKLTGTTIDNSTREKTFPFNSTSTLEPPK
ncbi:hypothetical protein DRO54_02620, partial [Candidatus Bathyarchaeota archaeon]